MREENQKEIDRLFEKGKTSSDKDEQLYCAKRINVLKTENKALLKRLMYMNSNISMLNQLKTAIDDKEFIKVNKKMSLNKLISNPADLQSYLASLNVKKMASEEKMANALDVFDEANSNYIENDKIYGESETDNELLAMFEYSNIEEANKAVNNTENIFNTESQEEETEKETKKVRVTE